MNVAEAVGGYAFELDVQTPTASHRGVKDLTLETEFLLDQREDVVKVRQSEWTVFIFSGDVLFQASARVYCVRPGNVLFH